MLAEVCNHRFQWIDSDGVYSCTRCDAPSDQLNGQKADGRMAIVNRLYRSQEEFDAANERFRRPARLGTSGGYRIQPHQEKERIVKLWEEGKTCAEIAAEYGCTAGAIMYHVRKVHPEAVNTTAAIDPWRNVAMCLDRAAGVTYAELARRHGLSRGRVSQIARVNHPYPLLGNLSRALGVNKHQVFRVLDCAKVLW
jgi:Mor family transcriptional regulator